MSCVSTPIISKDASTRAGSRYAPINFRIANAMRACSAGRSAIVARRCEKGFPTISPPANERNLRGGDATVSDTSRPRDVDRLMSLCSAEVAVLVDDRLPVLVGERASLSIKIFERAVDDEENLGILYQHKGVNRSWRLLNEIAGARNPVV